jgi:hypothetical protein
MPLWILVGNLSQKEKPPYHKKMVCRSFFGDDASREKADGIGRLPVAFWREAQISIK